MIQNECAFCDTESLDWRTIRQNEYCRSIVSNPSFRNDHCLVIPNRHIVRIAELTEVESVAVMSELGRLGLLLDKGYGTGIMQKYQPLEPDGRVKVSHLHMHIFPRFSEEPGLFPIPEPNSFEGFKELHRSEIIEIAGRLA